MTSFTYARSYDCVLNSQKTSPTSTEGFTTTRETTKAKDFSLGPLFLTINRSQMHSLLSSFLDDLIQSHGYGVQDVSITNDSAGCMLPTFVLLTNREYSSACDTEERNGPLLKGPLSFDMALAESVGGEIKKVTRWESVTSGAIAARPNNKERKGSPAVSVKNRKTSLDSTLLLPTRKESMDNFSKCHYARKSSALLCPKRKESMDNFSYHDVMESPKKHNASFDTKLQSGSLKRPNQSKNASDIARATLLDGLRSSLIIFPTTKTTCTLDTLQ
jgi:hypothetical protein